MRKLDKRTIPASEKEFVSERTCDLCGAKQKRPDADEWGDSSYDVSEVTIEYRSGSSYPEGGSGTEQRFDVCPKCFKEKLVAWMESQGATITETEWDY